MYQVIARKYRPQTFAELVSQEHVRTTIENAISQRRLAHGYIFAGQRGTGKTTVARILARCLNCQQGPTASPCGVCASCVEIPQGRSPDVIEIDAASNRGINEMRELRENVRYRPARDTYKVFIIDEAHQITTEAFNALLKTLEEPPEWVIFILCTTESHKIPVTIASRCQQFSFRSVDFEELMSRMRFICGEEGITAEEEALAVIALAGEGSVRDSLSALDQAIACFGNHLKAAEVRELLGQFSLDSLGAVSRALKDGDSAALLDVVWELERNGRSLQHFCRELARYFRNLLVKKIAPQNPRLIAASSAEQERLQEVAAWFSEEDLTRYLQITLDLFKELQYALQPRLHLEIGLLRLAHAGKLVALEEALANLGPGLPPPPPPAPRGTPAGAGGSGFSGARTGPRLASSSGPRAMAAVAMSAPPVITEPQPAPEPVLVPKPVAAGSWRERLHEELMRRGMPHTADAVAESDVQENAKELIFTAPNKLHAMTLKNDLPAVVEQLAEQPLKVTVKVGAVDAKLAIATAAAAPPDEQAVRERALAHPEIQRFQELFPEHQVRQVRNLKD
jgi:DNA polymerase-3 subunit gamma/tau